MYSRKDHTFLICAHNESSFLEEAVASVKNQTLQTNIIMTTSTPNEYIKQIAQKYDIPLYVNPIKTNALQSWMFAVRCAKTDLVTICHQDDTYEPEYAEKVLQAFNKTRAPIIAFTDYSELRNSKKITENKLLRTKRLMLSPLKFFPNSKFVRRRILSVGNAICCPSVTFHRETLLAHPFPENYIGNFDWAEWEILSRLKGSFIYVDKPLMCHRIHAGSTTSQMIGDSSRAQEDYIMIRKFWPSPIAKLIAKFYATSEKSNDLV